MKWLNNLLKDAPGDETAASVDVATPSDPVAETAPESPTVTTREPVSEAEIPASSEPAAVVQPDSPETMKSDVVPPLEPPAQSVPQLDALASRIGELQQLFESRIHSDEVQGKALEKLHDELRSYKANFIRQELQPFFKDVIFCHDFLANEIARLAERPGDGDENSTNDSGNTLRTLDHARQMLVDLLFKYDIEPYRGDFDQFDPKTQQCSKTIPTDIADQDKKIAAAILPGFRSPDNILRREQVTVFKHRPALASKIEDGG